MFTSNDCPFSSTISNQGLITKFKKAPLDISAGIQELDIPALKAMMIKMMSEESFINLDAVREYL